MTTTTLNIISHPKDYLRYEYKEFVVLQKMAAIYAECYPFFGWKLDSSISQDQGTKVALTFRRERKQSGLAQTGRLQVINANS